MTSKQRGRRTKRVFAHSAGLRPLVLKVEGVVRQISVLLNYICLSMENIVAFHLTIVVNYGHTSLVSIELDGNLS
jgi:hypothetical protein